jgi:hypothetical protein
MKRRLLLLGVGVAALGAILASGAIANPQGTDTAGPGGNVTVQTPSVAATLVDTDGEIPANGNPYNVADIFAQDVDSDYDLTYVDSAVTTPFGTTGSCGTVTAGLTNEVSVGTVISETALTTNVVDLTLALGIASDNDCVASGAVVTVTVEASGPDA